MRRVVQLLLIEMVKWNPLRKKMNLSFHLFGQLIWKNALVFIKSLKTKTTTSFHKQWIMFYEDNIIHIFKKVQ